MWKQKIKKVRTQGPQYSTIDHKFKGIMRKVGYWTTFLGRFIYWVLERTKSYWSFHNSDNISVKDNILMTLQKIVENGVTEITIVGSKDKILYWLIKWYHSSFLGELFSNMSGNSINKLEWNKKCKTGLEGLSKKGRWMEGIWS